MCAGLSAVAGAALAAMAYLGGNIIYSAYLNIMYVPHLADDFVFAFDAVLVAAAEFHVVVEQVVYDNVEVKSPQTTIPFVKNNNFDYSSLTSWAGDFSICPCSDRSRIISPICIFCSRCIIARPTKMAISRASTKAAPERKVI